MKLKGHMLTTETFATLGLSDATLDVLARKGFEEPTPIQVKTIRAMFEHDKDIIGQAQTGTGKTAAFGLPILERLEENPYNVKVLVLTPTRELAIQVAEEISSLKGQKKFSIVPIYGGQSISLQLRSLKKGVDIVVGTPGRVLDHIRRKTLLLGEISYLVLDEADEMLNMGFLEEVTDIIAKTNENKRTLLFSATMPDEILNIAKKYMGDYEVLKVTPGQLTATRTEQIYFEVSASDKFEALCRIIDIEEDFYGLVFCRTKIDVDRLAHHLCERGYDADGLHGDISQAMREKILTKFKKQFINILVATDVAARGIDVQDLTHVINYALPQDPESYVHRIGRTGRAGKEGNAITFITPEEYRKLQFIKRGAKTDIRKGTLPGIKDVIKRKKSRIKADLEQIAQSEIPSEYMAMSKELLSKNDPAQILAALLNYSFQDELNASTYAQIEDSVVDAKGTTRLFVGQGKIDGLSPKKLIDIIQEKCNISAKKIKNIEILEKFSFVTLPFNDAERVLSFFKEGKKKGKKKGFYVKKARAKR